MNPTQIAVLSDLIETARKSEPKFEIDTDTGRVHVTLWRLVPDGGRRCVIAGGATFAEAFARAVEQREKARAEDIVEAEVRAEVEARMGKAA